MDYIAQQAPLSMEFTQARILEWVSISYYRESSNPRDQTSCLLHLLHWQVDSLPLTPPGKQQVELPFEKYPRATVKGDRRYEIKRHLILGRKPMRNLDSVLKAGTSLCQQMSI